MIAARINGTTNVLTAPRGWNEERVGRCNVVPTVFGGQPVMLTAEALAE
jgi:hypothetical protein